MIQRITPSTPVARGRPSSQSTSPLAPARRARDLLQPYAPLISSPLKPSTSEGGRRSALLSSPRAPITIAPEPSQRNSTLAPVATAQSSIPPQSSPLATNVSRRILRIKFNSTLTPSGIAQRPEVSLISSTPPVANFRGSTKQLDWMSAAAATEQDPMTQNGSFKLPVTDAPSRSTQLFATSAPSAFAVGKRGVSLHPSSPSMQPGSPIAPAISAQSAPAILPFVPDPSTLQNSGSTGKLEVVCSCKRLKRGKAECCIQRNPPLASALKAPRTPAKLPVTSGSASAPASAPNLFQRSVSYLSLTVGAMVLICRRSSIYRLDLPLPLPLEKLRRQSQRLYFRLVGPCGSLPDSV